MSSLAIRILIVVGIVSALVAGYAVWRQHQRSQGAAIERAKQEKANAEFRVRVNRGTVDYDTCDAAGGLYDFRTRACKLP